MAGLWGRLEGSGRRVKILGETPQGLEEGEDAHPP
jgi:hypothetical protein